jgi:S-adenosyl methyltransferase
MTSDEPAAPGDGTAGKASRPAFDTSVAHQARVYDYLLGGNDNYAADRAAAEAWLKVNPDTVFTVRANRAFLGRAVRYLTAEAGIRQFLDIGTGIPTAGNTHHVAQAIAPETRVVYVDYDRCKSGCSHAGQASRWSRSEQMSTSQRSCGSSPVLTFDW